MDSKSLALLMVCIAILAVAGCTTTPSSPAVPTPGATAAGTPAVTAPAPVNALQCTADADCVPAQCCHPTGCVNRVALKACNEMCTMSCEGPLDCGAGSCGCVRGTCSVVPATGSPAVTVSKTMIRLEATPQRYSPMMSSTPGIALTVNATGITPATTNYSWTADYGQFLSWNPPDYTVNPLGATALNHGEKVYWSFTDKPASTAVPVTVTVTARDTRSGAELGRSTMTLGWDGAYAVMVRDIT
jgi:hypothetical protein